MTVDEYSQLPDDGIRYELQAGVLVSEPVPVSRHARVQMRIGYLLEAFVAPRGLGVVFGENGYLLSTDPDTLLGPDVSFVRTERYDPEEADRVFRGAPDLAIEVLSLSNRPREMHGKVADYLAAGAELVWVVDPKRRSVTVYRTLLSPRRVSGDEALDGEDVLPGFSVKVSELFT